MKRLIIAPHADDEALGCGGLIATNPEVVHVAVLADKHDGRMEEFHRARKRLRYTGYSGPYFDTGTLQNNMRALVTALDGIVREVRPTELYLPTPGTHHDHIAAYEAGISAARMSYTNGDLVLPDVFLYDVPGYVLELYQAPYRWNKFVPFGIDVLERKIAAIAEYESQMAGTLPAVRTAQTSAEDIGRKIAQPFAEHFAVVREVVWP